LNTIAADLPLSAASQTRQPKGLAVIFMTEMWERFSYYGMRALLVLYLVNALGYQRSDALQLYGIYTGLVYLTPMIGGYIADRWLGMRMAAVIGGVVMMLGHFAMAVPELLHVALGLLIIGNGFFSPTRARWWASCTTTCTTRGATAATRSSTWASTSAPRSRRWCAARWARRWAGTTASRPRAWAWPSACSRC